MKIHTTITPSARYAVIHAQFLDMNISVYECHTLDWALHIIVPDIKNSYIQSGYLVVFPPNVPKMYVYTRHLQRIAVVCIVKIDRRI